MALVSMIQSSQLHLLIRFLAVMDGDASGLAESAKW